MVAISALTSLGKVTIMAARTDHSLRRVCSALVDQLRILLGTASAPSSASRDQLARALFLVDDALQTLQCPTTRRPAPLESHLRDRQRQAGPMALAVRTLTGDDPDTRLRDQAQRGLSDLSAELAEQLPATVQSRFGTARLADYLRGSLAEALAMSLVSGVEVVRTALVEGCRTFTAVLGADHGGAAIEVRVPPAAAVQLAALSGASVHTRGTPPNVVETDPHTFLGLAMGLLSWTEAMERHLLAVSGSHATDLAVMLPVLDVRATLQRR